jgi:hypothetical protein
VKEEEEESAAAEDKEEERLAYTVEEEETEWSKVRFFNQIQTKTNASLTYSPARSSLCPSYQRLSRPPAPLRRRRRNEAR